jgi:pyrimidine-specific ribonucleoside hydrolase
VRDGAADETKGAARVPHGERILRILRAFPLDASSYQAPTAELVKAGIPEKFGHEEWAAVVLTNEVHQHVGIYSIVGAKMGVRARELLDAPTRAVNVTVETGGRPPVSCVIDGLQVALGSTLAQNLMHVPAPTEPRVAAVFEYKGRRLRLSLKPEFQRQIDEIIATAVKECGDLTPPYFQRIEAFSYRVWAEFDRRAIFSEETVTASEP